MLPALCLYNLDARIDQGSKLMSRWRPQTEKAKPYITAEGYRRLEAEYKELWDRRDVVVSHLAAAAAEGDRSENAEYQYRKKELREIDRRVRYLKKRTVELKIVDSVPHDSSKVFFGARVTLAIPSSPDSTYRIVGSDEADPARGDISVDSPMAKSLLGGSLGAVVDLPGVRANSQAEIVAIDYE